MISPEQRKALLETGSLFFKSNGTIEIRNADQTVCVTLPELLADDSAKLHEENIQLREMLDMAKRVLENISRREPGLRVIDPGREALDALRVLRNWPFPERGSR